MSQSFSFDVLIGLTKYYPWLSSLAYYTVEEILQWLSKQFLVKIHQLPFYFSKEKITGSLIHVFNLSFFHRNKSDNAEHVLVKKKPLN